MKHVISMIMMVAIGIMVSSFAEAKGVSAAQQKSVVFSSLEEVIKHTTNTYTNEPIKIIPSDVTYKAFKSVSRMSRENIKFTMLPIKVQGAGTLKNIMGRAYGEFSMERVVVTYTMYVYFNETNDLKYELSNVEYISRTIVQ